MTTSNKDNTIRRTQMLTELRKQHPERVKQAQELLKQEQNIRKQLQNSLKDGPLTAPQLAEATSVPAHQVLCYLATMKKYGLVEEAGMDEEGEYYLYRLSKEVSV